MRLRTRETEPLEVEMALNSWQLDSIVGRDEFEDGVEFCRDVNAEPSRKLYFVV
jgi:hypothetical protein